MVCVVVVVAYVTCSPELLSPAEETERRSTGRAKAELDSSPYAGGAVGFRFEWDVEDLCDCSFRSLFWSNDFLHGGKYLVCSAWSAERRGCGD